METLHAATKAMSAFSIDNGGYPTLQSLRASAETMEPFASDYLLRDAWGRDLFVMTSRRDEHATSDWFAIVSAGADGVFDESTWLSPAPTRDVSDDLVITPGGWLRWRPGVNGPLAACPGINGAPSFPRQDGTGYIMDEPYSYLPCCALGDHPGYVAEGPPRPLRWPAVASHDVSQTFQGVRQLPMAAVTVTMRDMLGVALTLASDATAHGGGYPTYQALCEPSSDFNRAAGHEDFVLRDAWGHEMLLYMSPEHEPSGRSKDFLLASAGADGKFDEATWSRVGENTSFDDDLVLTARGWIRWKWGRYNHETGTYFELCPAGLDRPRELGWPNPDTRDAIRPEPWQGQLP